MYIEDIKCFVVGYSLIFSQVRSASENIQKKKKITMSKSWSKSRDNFRIQLQNNELTV